MKARRVWRRHAKKDRNRSAIAKKGWETRRQRLDEAGGFMAVERPMGMGDHAPFHVPPDEPVNPAPSDEAIDTAELDASNLTFRSDEGAGFRGSDDNADGYWSNKPCLGPSVTLIKVNGTEEIVELSPFGEGLKADQDEVDRLKRRSEVVNEMRAVRNQVPLGPVRDRLDEELEVYKERIEKERAQERMQSQEAHAAALRATVERVLVQGFMGDMRGNADFKTQASHWLMNMDQAEAVFAALQRAGY